MSIRDRNIDWNRKQVYIPYKEWTGIIGVAAGLEFVGLGTGLPVATEITALEIGGLPMVTADIVDHNFPVPFDLDPAGEVGFNVHWASDSVTDADDVVFTLKTAVKAAGVALANAATALDTIVPADVIGTAAALAHQWTGRGVMNAIGLTLAQIDAHAELILNLTSTTVDPAGSMWFLGVMMDYKVRAATPT